MINKRLFIGAGIALAVALFGGLAFLYLRDPELFTKTPMEIISGRVGDNIKIDAPVDTPSIIGDNAETDKLKTAPTTTNFIVPDEHWQNAFILGRSDDLKGPRGVGFSDIPIETEIRAPISGYVFLYTAMWENLETVEIVISEYEDGLEVTENRRFFFLANHFYPINISGRIEKGEALARVRVQSEVLPGFFDRKTIFAMGFKGDWNTDLTIEDPREFLWVPIQQKIVGEDK